MAVRTFLLEQSLRLVTVVQVGIAIKMIKMVNYQDFSSGKSWKSSG